MTALIVSLQDLAADALPLGGGKAVNLGVLLRAGLPVPPGFCLTTEAYAQAAEGLPVHDPQRAREQLASRPVPAAVASALAAAYRQLSRDAGVDALPVAVRSSATAEDLPYASFAGQQDTVLDVVGEAALLAAVRRCWASLWTDRAVAYRAANDIDPAGVRLAVVVQRMVPARAAGVLFTADPLTGRRGRAVIDAAPGLGDAVVSGAVNPDHYVVATGSGAVLERHLQSSQQGCLDEGQLRRLAALGQTVERLYDGAPQDIEFAVDHAGQLWLLQARAITTLYPLPPEAPPPDSPDLRVYFSVNVAQGVLRPLTRMGQQMFRVAASGFSALEGVPQRDRLRGPHALAVAGERLFLDATPVVRSRLGRRIAGFALTRMEARSAAVIRSLADDPRLTPLPGWPARALRRAVYLILRGRVVPRAIGALRDPAGARAVAQAEVQRVLDLPLGGPDAGPEQRLLAVEQALAERIPAIAAALLPLLFTGVGAFVLAFRLLGRRVTPEERDDVRRALPHNPTTEMDLALWALGERLRADPASSEVLAGRTSEDLADAYHAGTLPPALQQGLDAFLAEHGHRGVAEIDLGLPRWSEAPAQVLGVLSDFLRRPAGSGRPDEHFAAGAARAEALAEELAARRGRLLGPLVRVALRRGRELAGLREAPKEAVMALTARLRREVLIPLGAELAAAGHLEKAADLAFLDLREARELLGGADLRARVRARRATYDAEVRRRRVPRILLSDGTEPAASPTDQLDAAGSGGADDALRGAPASAGVVSGEAAVVLDPVAARLEPGQILVAPSTDPGWTPLFLTAGGLVMEMGGAMSHGAVVAREYGIPAVVGVPDATTRIAPGQQITVDGSAGVVLLDAGADAQADSPVGTIDLAWRPPQPGSVWVRRQVVEHMPGPLSPLFEELYLLDGLERAYRRVLGELGLNLDFMFNQPLFATVNGYAYSRGDIDLPLRAVPQLVRAAGVSVPYMLRKAQDHWRRQALPAYLEVVQRWRVVDPAAASPAELLRGIRELVDADAAHWAVVAMVVGAAKVSDATLQRFLGVALHGSDATSGRFLRGYPSRTLEADAALEELAAGARRSPELREAVAATAPDRWRAVLPDVPGGRELLAGLDGYLRDYGHQVYSLDFAEPTLGEQPEPVLASLRARVAGDHVDVMARHAELVAARQQEVVSTAARLGPLRRRAFLAVLGWAQRFAPAREDALFHLGAGWPTVRRLASELGGRLHAAGALDDPEDIYYLTSPEIEQAIELALERDGAGEDVSGLAARARARRGLQERRRQLQPPPTVPPGGRMRIGRVGMSAWETARRNAPESAQLTGFAVSPGRVTAPASVVLGPEGFADMTPGSILVCPTTSPAWTPLLAQAAALVTDIGGVLAHGSIVAREYGIPAVMGTGSATLRISNGQLITVDGDRGVVELDAGTGQPSA